MRIIKPRALYPGDTIGLVSPAGPIHERARVTPESLDLRIRQIQDLGFGVRLAGHALACRGYLAGPDAGRLQDLHAMFADPGIAAIFCLQGGYGSLRLLPRLDYALIRSNPKIFLGFSDITALHLALHGHTGLVTFHGPMAGSNWNGDSDVTRGWLLRLLTSPAPPGELVNPPGSRPCRTITPGIATGKLVGGCLSLVAATLGTPYEPDTAGNIVFLEDVDEAPYRIDRMLTHLTLAGKLQAAAGIIIGECLNCEPPDPARPSLTLDEVLADIIAPLGKPAIYGLRIGHGRHRLTLPLGVRATLDASACRLFIEEGAVLPS